MTAARSGAVPGTIVFGLLFAGMVRGEDAGPALPGESESFASSVLIARTDKPLNLLLTQAELRSFIRNYEMETGETLTAPIIDDDVIVTAPGLLAPMRDVSQDAWGGIAAPFWAILNPKDAWRIFVPIPPKGRPKKDEPPAPDPR